MFALNIPEIGYRAKENLAVAYRSTRESARALQRARYFNGLEESDAQDSSSACCQRTIGGLD
jgi:hypothetical protein